ncbi:FHA domain-containing protein [Mycobacterium sp. JS623]|uniref:FHA domain-containing protein n=1 Tax=Mycobacterium sp. JS623 TaxID=212767 RepID=UPI00059B9059|nr:FHA domain-containing protein [Mycobacterium sp. JS623]
MSRPPLHTITVYAGGWHRTFGPGGDLVIGRDVHADIRLPQPGVSRAHVLLRYLDGQWVAVDNASTNGMFVDKQRVSSVDIRDGQTIHIGEPDGPPVTFELGRDGEPPDDRTTIPTELSNIVTNVIRVLRPGAEPPPGSTTIGREVDNDIVIPDLLASRHHARLIPTAQGVQIQDISSNGTFVNGQRISETYLAVNDVVTIANVDMLFVDDGTLVPRRAPAAEPGLDVRDISLSITGNHTLLERVSFSAKPATLTAVIGPSGSGKSTLLNVIAGAIRPHGGLVSFDGHDIHAEYALLRNRIGMVPQDDVVHRQLTVTQALGYAAELRMSHDTTKDERLWVARQVLEELELTPHADTRIENLSGGQRKRASVALELLTGPSLLVLDEPTTGLDPALDQLVMKMLRQLADAGRIVVVVTHSLAYLDVCDQVLLLAPGGKTAYCGPPGELGDAMGSTDWADIFTDIEADPDAAHRRFLERAESPIEPRAQAEPKQPVGKPVRAGLWRQLSTVARRQVRLIRADRGYFVFLVLLPFLLGLLPLAVAGQTGFGKAAIESAAPNEPKQIVVLLNLGAIFMGTALTVRELVGERIIFRREQAAGLSTSAYLGAKVVVFAAAAVVQSAILVLIVTAPTIGKGVPLGASVLGSPRFELFVDIAATCVAAAILGLLVSALAQNSNQVLPLMVVTVMTQLVLAGGFIPVTDRPLDPVSWLTPSRWGLAATASTVDLTNTVAVIPRDSHWKHTAAAWTFDIGMLGVLAVCYLAFARRKIRFKAITK